LSFGAKEQKLQWLLLISRFGGKIVALQKAVKKLEENEPATGIIYCTATLEAVGFAP
jgi:hypothetical protein